MVVMVNGSDSKSEIPGSSPGGAAKLKIWNYQK